MVLFLPPGPPPYSGSQLFPTQQLAHNRNAANRFVPPVLASGFTTTSRAVAPVAAPVTPLKSLSCDVCEKDFKKQSE